MSEIMTDHVAFEWMIHLMEFGVVLGIGTTIWYIKTHEKKDERHDRTQND